MRIRLRLKPRITLGTLLILFICLMAVSALFINRERERLYSELELQGGALANLVAKFSAAPIEKYSFFIVQDVARNVEQAEGVAYCEIYDAEGKSLVQVDMTIRGEKVVKNPRVINDDIFAITRPITIDERVLGTVEIGFELEPVKRQILSYIFRLGLVVIVVMILVGVCINLFLNYMFISPVVKLSNAVKDLARGEFVETQVEQRADEIGDLARAFNHMSNSLRHLYHKLESKVMERTADLAETNSLLEKEIQVRKKVEKDLKEAKETAERANQYKSNFVAHMSHEIRTPLNAILGYAQILQARDDLDGQLKKGVEAIDRSGSHLLGLINDILDLSKIEAGRVELKREPFDLSVLIRNLASMFQLRCAEKGLNWRVEGIDSQQVIPVTGDAGKLRQILINLLGNAVKFTDSGEVVLHISGPLPNEIFRFTIEDTGPGVPEHLHRDILEPFSEMGVGNTGEGTGLGLSITSKFLEMMDSRLEISKHQPRGACFSFSLALPSIQEDALPEEKTGRKIVGFIANEQITALVVDDDTLSRAMLTHLLKKSGVHTLEAENGKEALALLEENRVNIIFLDRYMPQMDGAETVKHISQRYGEHAPPIVLITAAAFDSIATTKEQLGLAGIIIKPFKLDEVIECMGATLGLKLKVEDTATDAAREQGKSQSWHVEENTYRLPQELHNRLQSAAEFGRLSELKNLAIELEQNADVHPQFAGLLRDLLESYRLDELLEKLKRTEPI